jgi:hypothetical protein
LVQRVGIVGWLKSLFGGSRSEVTEEESKLAAAEKFGRDAASSVVADLDRFIAVRFGHIHEAYLGILNKNIDDDLVRTDHSPILLARADFSVFNENVTETRERMRAEIVDHMKRWDEVLTTAGVPEGVEKVTHHRLDDICTNLTVKGLELFVSRADELIAADDKWRANFPEQARLEPRD